MRAAKMSCCADLRSLCFFAGYLNLVVAALDILFHVCAVAVLSHGIQCDKSLSRVLALEEWPWFMRVLLALNVGSHGLIPFPAVLETSLESLPLHPKCNPYMFHIYLLDVLIFLMNFSWLNCVLSFVRAIHMRNPSSMRMFFYTFLVKGMMQHTMYYYVLEAYFPMINCWRYRLFDLCIGTTFLIIIHAYIRELEEAKDTDADEKQQPDELLTISPKYQEAIGIDMTEDIMKTQDSPLPTYETYMKK